MLDAVLAIGDNEFGIRSELLWLFTFAATETESNKPLVTGGDGEDLEEFREGLRVEFSGTETAAAAAAAAAAWASFSMCARSSSSGRDVSTKLDVDELIVQEDDEVARVAASLEGVAASSGTDVTGHMLADTTVVTAATDVAALDATESSLGWTTSEEELETEPCLEERAAPTKDALPPPMQLPLLTF